MHRAKIKWYDFLMGLYFLLVFNYVFNTSFFGLFSSCQSLAIILSVSIATLALTLANLKFIKKRSPVVPIMLLAFLALVLIRNGDIANGVYIPVIYVAFLLYSVYILSFSDRWHKIALIVFNIFVVEHVIGTIVCYLFPDFYSQHILPLFPDATHELSYEFSQKRIAGLTNHYSKNALYLTAGLLVNFSVILNKVRQHKIIGYILLFINFVALLLTGKRLHAIVCLAIFLFILALKYRKQIFKFIKTIVILAATGTALLLAVANFVPSITNSFTRAYESLGDTNSMRSRNVLYDLAAEEFDEHPILGIGWNNYKYQYHDSVYAREREYMTAHNIYLQVLCETGLVGALFVFSTLVFLLILPLKDLKKAKTTEQTTIIYIFLAMHLFFMLEGVLGNSLYDLQTYSPYLMTLSAYIFTHFQIIDQFRKELKDGSK